MPTAFLNDQAFHTTEVGEGEPVVLIHGSVSDARTWDRQLDLLAQRFRVIAYSRRYHWPNAHIPDGADYAMADHVDDLAALLQTLDAAPAHLVGHSYGGFIALLLALREPQLVRTLVLAEPPVLTLFVSNTPTPLELLRLATSRPRLAAGLIHLGATALGPAAAAAERGDMEEVMRRLGQGTLGRAAYQRLSNARREQVRANLIAAELLGSGFPPLAADALRGLQCPTLLVMGEASPRVFHRLVDALEELLPQSERVEIPAASHIMHEDNASAYTVALLAFLEAHREVL
ncbi:MAG: alpha/beta hydrolase [Rubricoccaceae bacterium]